MDSKLKKIESEAPQAYKELKNFVREEYYGFFEFHKLTFEVLPHEFLIGIILKYFNKNNIDFTISDTDEGLIFDAIVDTFREYEKVISHYS